MLYLYHFRYQARSLPTTNPPSLRNMPPPLYASCPPLQVSVLNVSHCHLAEYEEEQRASVEAAVRSLTTLKLVAFSSKDFASAAHLQRVVEEMPCKLFYTL